MTPVSDRELIASAAKGHVAAFATLVGRYRDVRTRFAVRMLGSQRAADEALQGAFVRAFQSIVRYKEPEPFADWLFRIIINECRARALRHAVRARRTLSGEFDVIPESASTEVEDEGQRALNQIDPINREAFILQYIEELTYAQIATLTGASVVTLERQVDRACARLRELLPNWEKEEEQGAGLIRFDDVGPSFPVRVALPLRRAEVLDDSFEDRLMAKLLRPGEAADALVAAEDTESPEQRPVEAPSPLSPNPAMTNVTPSQPPTSLWTQEPNRPSVRIPSLPRWAVPAAVAVVVALGAFGAGYGLRGRKDARLITASRAKAKPAAAAPKLVRKTDTVRVVRSDTVLLARFVVADQSAHSVSVIGDFNHWEGGATPMTRASGSNTWATTLKLKPGRYEYAFLVDGKQWMMDHAARSSRDPFDMQSSVLTLAGASAPSNESSASARLKKLLPHATADRVLSTIATARTRGLPATTLENHALKYVAEHVAAKEVDRIISAEATHMARANALLASAGRSEPSPDEITAGALLVARDADSTGIFSLVRAAPPARSLAVPFLVSAELIASDVAARDAVAKVSEKLRAGVTDAQLERLADDAARVVAKGKGKTKPTQVAKSGSGGNVKQAGSPSKSKAAAKKKKAS